MNENSPSPPKLRKVLILCTGNSCRSIMAEALVNRELASRGILAFSAGSRPTGRIHPEARAVLRRAGAWESRYHSKTVEEVMDEGPFDLLVTVCDHAKKACPVFPGTGRKIHLGFDDPDGQPPEAFSRTLREIRKRLLPLIVRELER